MRPSYVRDMLLLTPADTGYLLVANPKCLGWTNCTAGTVDHPLHILYAWMTGGGFDPSFSPTPTAASCSAQTDFLRSLVCAAGPNWDRQVRVRAERAGRSEQRQRGIFVLIDGWRGRTGRCGGETAHLLRASSKLVVQAARARTSCVWISVFPCLDVAVGGAPQTGQASSPRKYFEGDALGMIRFVSARTYY
jgi:hypothetical protein